MTDFEFACLQNLVKAEGIEAVVGTLADICRNMHEDAEGKESWSADIAVLESALATMKFNDENRIT